MNRPIRTRYVLMHNDSPEAVFTDAKEAQAVADILKKKSRSYYWVATVFPSGDVIDAVLAHRRIWASSRDESQMTPVADMADTHLENAAHLCLTWQERMGSPMSPARRVMCQNVRGEIVRRDIARKGA